MLILILEEYKTKSCDADIPKAPMGSLRLCNWGKQGFPKKVRQVKSDDILNLVQMTLIFPNLVFLIESTRTANKFRTTSKSCHMGTS